ncbi:MAG: AAA family ATPase [Saprospiraceae bacterium]
MHHRTNIFGAPGAGTTTLAKALAQRLGCAFFDTDDYYWFTDDPLPYRRKRNPEHRLRLLRADLEQAGNCVVSGALLGWGDTLLPGFDAVVYRWLPTETRLERIRQRETARYGAERIALGGDLHGVFEKFMLWAADYDQAPETRQRGLLAEEAWLKNGCEAPVLRLTDDLPVPVLVERMHLFSTSIRRP